MTTALIGYTGFVGGDINRQRSFDAHFNSKNYHTMAGRFFGEVICAGVPAVKWKANKEPEADRAAIAALEDVLRKVHAERFVLISTIDVYPLMAGVDESFDCHSRTNHAYGAHRLAFEDFCRKCFADCRVIRLPGLFGEGLKKNVIFDLLNDNCLEMINPMSSIQYYDLADISADIDRVLSSDLRLVNFFTPPISNHEILDRFFPEKAAAVGGKPSQEVHYDLWTRYASLWDLDGKYICTREEVLERLARFIQLERVRRQ